MMAVQFESGQGTALGELPLEFAEILWIGGGCVNNRASITNRK